MQVFKSILVKCKITKFWEVNFKILTQILAIPVVIAAVQKTQILPNVIGVKKELILTIFCFIVFILNR